MSSHLESHTLLSFFPKQSPTTSSTTPLLSHLRSVNPLLFHFIPALLSYFMSTLLSLLILVFFSYLISTLLSCSIPTLLSSIHILATKSPFLAFISYFETLTALLSCLMLGKIPTYFIFYVYQIFKWTLSDEYLRYRITCSTELFYLFLTINPLPEKSKRKWSFDIMFIYSCPLTSNYTAEEVYLSFGKYEYLALIKLNWW